MQHWVTWLLPLVLLLLGAIVGVLFAQWMGVGATTRTWWSVVTLLVLATIVMTGYLIREGIATDRRVRELAATIRAELDEISKIEYDMRHAGELSTRSGTPLQVDTWEGKVEAWRIRVSQWLATELPGSGADMRFRTGSGTPNEGRPFFIYTQIGVLRSNLSAILDNLPSYVQRSR